MESEIGRRPCARERRRRWTRHVRTLGIERLERRDLLTAYTWQNVAISAGGFVDGIFYDPHNQNVIYARTDIGGLYKTTNDGASWTQLLDFVGQNTDSSGNGTQSQLIGVLAFAIDPQNSNNIYADVGEYAGSNGAVFYSTNGGQTWGQTNLNFYVGGNSNGRGDGEQIAVDPNNSNIVYLGSNDHGLWKSTDAGHSFTQISAAAFAPTSTTFVLFDPASGTPGNTTQTIYVGINSTSSGTNLYQTTDGGTTWAQSQRQRAIRVSSGSRRTFRRQSLSGIRRCGNAGWNFDRRGRLPIHAEHRCVGEYLANGCQWLGLRRRVGRSAETEFDCRDFI